MNIVELTAENIEKYLDGCLETQQHLVRSQEEVSAEQFIATADAPHAHLIAVIEDERVAGLGVVNKIVHPVRTNAYVDNIVVHPDFRGRGLFTIIMDELEQKAKEWGAVQIKLTCSRESVQPLYEKRGYKEKDTKYYFKTL
jgi:GNAT superfamily N-acetyltransferase